MSNYNVNIGPYQWRSLHADYGVNIGPYQGGVLPVITDYSGGSSVLHEGSITLWVTATGYPSLSYQWYKDGSLLSGEIGSSLMISSAEVSDGGDYTCEVTDESGTVVSDTMTILIIPYIISHARYNAFNRQIDQDRS